MDRFETYEDYVRYYCETVLTYLPYGERLLQMDAYPYTLDTNRLNFRECFISSLETMGYIADEYSADKWTCTQNHEYIYNPASVLYQYYTGMAYGYTHFTTYTYGCPSWYYPQQSINVNNEKTDNYYYYQQAHEEIKSFENVYREFTDNWIGTMAFDGNRETDRTKPYKNARKLMESYPRIESVTNSEDTLIGIMKDKNGYEGFMVTNQVLPDSNIKDNVTIKFKEADKVIVYTNGEPQKIMDTDNGEISLTLKSGGGAFLIPVKGV